MLNHLSTFDPTPSERQLRWHGLEFYGFIHFGMNTFTDKEWGFGDDSPSTFNPTDFDACQIAETAADSGMAGLILTCKHHDGFCLWPSRHTYYSVKNSPWRNGEGDIVREISDACRRSGILFGVYLSPWDRNHPDYGTSTYIDYYRAQLCELTTEYGELFEIWFDGANGSDGYYGGAREIRGIDRKTYYDWENTWRIVRENQPNAVMFSDAGPDIRWVGNESGFAGDPCWHTLSAAKLYPGFGGDEPETRGETDMVKAWASDGEILSIGDPDGVNWLPAECDVSIRPGWFHHDSENDKVRSSDNLMDLYYKSVGRGASLLLNLPPDKRGRIHERDIEALRSFRKRRAAVFAENLAMAADATCSSAADGTANFAEANVSNECDSVFWMPEPGDDRPELRLTFKKHLKVNVVGLREHLPLGQRIRAVSVEANVNGEWRKVAEAASVGNRRLFRFPAVEASGLKLTFAENADPPVVSDVSAHFDPA